LPYILKHAEQLEQQLEQCAPDKLVEALHLTDDVLLRSFNWARWQLGIPLPAE
jgi:hypothetical protein